MSRRTNADNERGRCPPTSRDLEDFATELGSAGNRTHILTRARALKYELEKILAPADFEFIEVTGRAAKKNFAQRFSASIAQKIANEMRKTLPEIVPDCDGKGHESLSRGALGLKKIDVNYSTTRSGLELAVSVKTLNFSDEKSKRYTKNVKRIDGELRAEAQDCHGRQPYAVIAAYLFMPLESATDGAGDGPSSARHAAEVLHARTGRDVNNRPEGIELSYLALYDDEGRVTIARPQDVPPSGAPAKTMTFASTLNEISQLHRRRNPR